MTQAKQGKRCKVLGPCGIWGPAALAVVSAWSWCLRNIAEKSARLISLPKHASSKWPGCPGICSAMLKSSYWLLINSRPNDRTEILLKEQPPLLMSVKDLSFEHLSHLFPAHRPKASEGAQRLSICITLVTPDPSEQCGCEGTQCNTDTSRLDFAHVLRFKEWTSNDILALIHHSGVKTSDFTAVMLSLMVLPAWGLLHDLPWSFAGNHCLDQISTGTWNSKNLDATTLYTQRDTCPDSQADVVISHQ